MERRVTLITGASVGLGLAIARRMLDKTEDHLILTARASSLSRFEKENLHESERIWLRPLDVTSEHERKLVIWEAVEKLGGVDVLINNAGVIEPISHLSASDPDEWSQVIDINLKGVYNGMRAVLPVMKDAGGGSILTISSGAAHHAIEAWSHYCASKAAVNMMGRSIHLEEAANGIRAIGLSPGTVATQMQREIKASGINPVSELAWEDHIPADWPARALLWMCSAEADTYCGEEISLRDEGIRKAIGLV